MKETHTKKETHTNEERNTQRNASTKTHKQSNKNHTKRPYKETPIQRNALDFVASNFFQSISSPPYTTYLRYLKFHEKRPGKIKESSPPPAATHFLRGGGGSGGDHIRSARGSSTFDPREIHGKALADLRQHAGEAPPNDLKVKDPVLSPSSPTAPNPAIPSNANQSHHHQQSSRHQNQHSSSSSSSPSMMRSSTTQHHNHHQQPKLSPNAIRVPFMTPMLPGSPMATQQASSPPSSPSARERFLRSDNHRNNDAKCNDCSSSSFSSAPLRSDVIDLSTAFPAWNAGPQKPIAKAPVAPGGESCCTHNQHNQHVPSSKDIANQYQRLSSKTNSSEYHPPNAQPQEPQHRMIPSSSSQIGGSASPARKHHPPSSQQSQQQQQPASSSSYPPGSPELRRNREGLIEPKKLVNPCLESKERQVLHRELMQISTTTQGEMSAMLPKKSELRQVFEKRQEKQREKDVKTKPDFEKVLEEHVEKLQKHFHVGEENLFHQTPQEDDRVEVKKIPSSPRLGLGLGLGDDRSKSAAGGQPEFVRMRAKLAEKPKS